MTDDEKVFDIGSKHMSFGSKYIYMPHMLENQLSFRSKSKKYTGRSKRKPISDALKKIFIDIIFYKKFCQKDYDDLAEEEQLLFDEACSYAGVLTNNIAKAETHSSKKKKELMKQFEVYKGELLMGNDNTDLLRKMRNLLMQLKKDALIANNTYDKLMAEILLCI